MLRRDKTWNFRNLSYHGFMGKSHPPDGCIETPKLSGPQYLKILYILHGFWVFIWQIRGKGIVTKTCTANH
jgi:hypothetical protein